MINVTNSIFRSRCIIQFLKKLLMCTQIPLSQCSQVPGGLFRPKNKWKKTTHPTWHTIWIKKNDMNLNRVLLYYCLDIQKVYKKKVFFALLIFTDELQTRPPDILCGGHSYRLFFLRSIAQFFTQIYMNCLVSS